MKHMAFPGQCFVRRVLPVLMILCTLACFTVPTAQAASLHPTTPTKALSCTPNNYHLQSEVEIRDEGTNEYLGVLDLSADGCGWVYASANTVGVPGDAVINHLEIHRVNDGSLVTAASYNGTQFNQTIHVDVGNTYVYAFGVVQDSFEGFWGENWTLTTNGYA